MNSVIFGQIFLNLAKMAMIHKEGLAIFGYKLNMKVKYPSLKSHFWLKYLKACRAIWRFFLHFDRIMAIENLNVHLILALFNL